MRSLPKTAWAAAALFLVTMVFWTIASPTYRPADESDHVSAALSWEENHEWPGFKELKLLVSVDRSTHIAGLRDTADSTIQFPSLTADAATPRPDRPAFADLGDGYIATIDKSGQHPPLYYMLLGTIAQVFPDGISWDLVVWLFRLVSVILLAPLPLLAAATARVLGASRRVQSAAALALLAVPQLALMGGAVNNDNLLNAAGAWLALGLALVLRGDLRKRTALWIGLVAAVALLTKAWAIPLVAVLCLGYLIAAIRSRRLRATLAAFGVFVAAAATGGWWWVRSYLIYGSVQPAGHHVVLDEPLSLRATLSLVGRMVEQAFPTRFWALLSVKNGFNPYPLWIPAVLTVALAITLILAIVFAPALTISRVDVVVSLVPTALTFAILMAEVLRLAQKTGNPAGVQGRYLYSSIVLLLVVAVIGVASFCRVLAPQGDRIVVALVGAFGIGFTALSLARGISFAFGEERWSNPLTNFDSLRAWAPIPAALSTAIAVAFAVAAVAVASVVAVGVLRPHPDDAPARRARRLA